MHGEMNQFDETILQLGGKKTPRIPRVSFLHVFTTNLCHTSAIEHVFFRTNYRNRVDYKDFCFVYFLLDLLEMMTMMRMVTMMMMMMMMIIIVLYSKHSFLLHPKSLALKPFMSGCHGAYLTCAFHGAQIRASFT